jgi:hypothetical protein
MVSVDAKFTVRDVKGMPNAGEAGQACSVESVLVYTGDFGNLLFIADWTNSLIRAFDLVTWQCVSICRLVSGPRCLYQVKGQVYVHCGKEIFRITVAPLAASLHGKTLRHYDVIANIGHYNLIAKGGRSVIHIIATSGQLVNDITTKTGYSFYRIFSLTADDIQVVVVDTRRYTYTKKKVSTENCLVCLTVSEEGSSVSLSWTYDDIQSQRDPIFTSGVVIVLCSNPNAFILKDRYSGLYLKKISPPNDPKVGYGTCIYNDRLFIGAGGLGVVMEFHILGKYNMICGVHGRILGCVIDERGIYSENILYQNLNLKFQVFKLFSLISFLVTCPLSDISSTLQHTHSGF